MTVSNVISRTCLCPLCVCMCVFGTMQYHNMSLYWVFVCVFRVVQYHNMWLCCVYVRGVADLPNKRLYWVDSKLHLISSVDFSGANRRVLLSSPQQLGHPFALSVFEVKCRAWWQFCYVITCVAHSNHKPTQILNSRSQSLMS